MKPPRPHPLIARASALARTRNWPTVWSVGRQACLALGATTRLTVNAAPDGPLVASVSFHLDPDRVGARRRWRPSSAGTWRRPRSPWRRSGSGPESGRPERPGGGQESPDRAAGAMDRGSQGA